jgi:hypothetical protein
VIEYLREDKRVLREQVGDRRLSFNDQQRRRNVQITLDSTTTSWINKCSTLDVSHAESEQRRSGESESNKNSPADRYYSPMN